MRGLTVRQKKALTSGFNKFIDDYRAYPVDTSDLPNIDVIYDMNPSEVFWQNADRFLYDLRWSIGLDKR